jgi:capsular polysaccharide biosynthesis protein
MLFNKSSQLKKVIIFGTGSAAIKYVKRIRKTHEVICFLDNNLAKNGTTLNGVSICPPDDIKRFPNIPVIIASDFFDEIYAQLKENKNFLQTNIVYYRSVKTNEVLREKISLLIKGKVWDLICNTPHFLMPIIQTLLKLSSLSLFRIGSLEDQHEHRILTLRSELQGTSVGPNFVNRRHNRLEVTIPTVGLYQFLNCQISMLSRAFKIDSKSIVVEKIHTISDEVTKYNKGHLIHHYQNKLALVRDEQQNILQNGILINGFYDKNYYHWVVDILPQLQYIQELPEKFKNFPILISNMSQKYKSIKELIELFNIEREVIYLPSVNDYLVKNLLVISSPNRCCPRIIGSAWSFADYTYSRPESILYLRDLVLKQSNSSIEEYPKRIFLSPSMKHRKYNQGDVFHRLKKFGFVKFNPENMGIMEQALMFNRAEIIVGPTGATWTNIIFAKHGANALCWMAEEWGDFSSFSNIADIVGINLNYLTYVAGVDDHIDLFSQEYVIDQQTIENWVQGITDK